jgi:hypothetical protein
MVKRTKVRGKYKRMDRISELADQVFEDQFNEETPPADTGDLVELLCLLVDQLKELSGKPAGDKNE